MDWFFDSPRFVEFVVLFGVALLVGVARWSWLANAPLHGARLRRTTFLRPGYAFSDDVGWAHLEVRGPPVAATVLVLGVGVVGLMVAHHAPLRDGLSSMAGAQAKLGLLGVVAVFVGFSFGSSRLDVRLDSQSGLEVRHVRPLRRDEVWRVARPREVSLLVGQSGALDLTVKYVEGADDDASLSDQRFFFAGLFADDDPVLDRDLALASETLSAIAAAGGRP